MAQLIKKRVIEQGKDANNSAFTPYSTAQMPSFFYYGKSRNASAEKAVKAAKKVSYKDFRSLNNLETDKKNFEFTGDMWRNFGVVSTRQENGIVKITIGGQSTDAQNKIDWLSAQENQSIIEPSASEIGVVNSIMSNWVNEIFDANF